MVKLIASDLDGTLLQNGAHDVNPIVFDQIRILKEHGKHLKEMFSSEIKVVTSGNLWVDFICPTANKGSALKDLIDHLHIDAKDCVVFGDQYNDVEMLQIAGTSYAMANAAPGIDKYATHVTGSVEKILQQIIDEL